MIKLARAIQAGESVSKNVVSEALGSGRNESKYAQALERGLNYLTAANRFFTGKMTFNELKGAFDIGKPDVLYMQARCLRSHEK